MRSSQISSVNTLILSMTNSPTKSINLSRRSILTRTVCALLMVGAFIDGRLTAKISTLSSSDTDPTTFLIFSSFSLVAKKTVNDCSNFSSSMSLTLGPC